MRPRSRSCRRAWWSATLRWAPVGGHPGPRHVQPTLCPAPARAAPLWQAHVQHAWLLVRWPLPAPRACPLPRQRESAAWAVSHPRPDRDGAPGPPATAHPAWATQGPRPPSPHMPVTAAGKHLCTGQLQVARNRRRAQPQSQGAHRPCLNRAAGRPPGRCACCCWRRWRASTSCTWARRARPRASWGGAWRSSTTAHSSSACSRAFRCPRSCSGR